MFVRDRLAATGSELVAVTLLLAFTLGRLDAYLLVVFLKRREILTSFRKLSLFHALADVPMHERALGIHQVELMIDARENFSDSRGIADHANSAHDLGKVAAWHNGGWLVIDAALKSRGAPIHELDRTLGLDRRHRCVHILRHDIP